METAPDLDALLSQICSSSSTASSGLVVLNFFTEECYTCKTLNPKLKQFAVQYPGVQFVKVRKAGLWSS